MRTIGLIALFCVALAGCGETDGNGAVAPPQGQQPDGQDAQNDEDDHNDDEDEEWWADIPIDEIRDYDGPIGEGDRQVKPIFPDDYDVEGDHPLLFLLHGLGSSAEETLAGFDAFDEADDRGVVMLAPEGDEDTMGNKFWNAIDTCCDFERSNPDHVGYLTDLIDEAVERYAVDPEKIFFLGISNGAMMSHRMACDRGERVRGIISFNGTSFQDPEDCAPDAPVEILHVHATDDELVPYDGNAAFPAADAVVDRWAEWNQCDDDPDDGSPINVTAAVEGDETDVQRWSGCTERGDVEFWTMNNAEHVPLPLADFPRLMFDTILGEQ